MFNNKEEKGKPCKLCKRTSDKCNKKWRNHTIWVFVSPTDNIELFQSRSDAFRIEFLCGGQNIISGLKIEIQWEKKKKKEA